MQIRDKTHQAHDGMRPEDVKLSDGLENKTPLEQRNTEEVAVSIDDCESEDNNDVIGNGSTISSECVEERTADEGWQDCNRKGRLSATRQFGQRRPILPKLNVTRSENSVVIGRNSRRGTLPSVQKKSPRATTTESSLARDRIRSQTKASVSKVLTSPTNLTAIASKSLSYKEVAASPPGTVLKPFLEKVENLSEENTETQMCSIEPEISKEENHCGTLVKDVADDSPTEETHQSVETSASEPEEVSSSNQEKPVEMHGSKLSAAAEPFNPMSQPLNSVPVTSIYDVGSIQGLLSEPAGPPVAARVPCGPRSPLYYYRGNRSYGQHGFLKCRAPVVEAHGFGPSRIMNPHAPEYVPRRAWQTDPMNADSSFMNESNSSGETSDAECEKLDKKPANKVNDKPLRKSSSDSEKSELARQILLSFIVKSVQQKADASCQPAGNKEKEMEPSENSSDAVANDSAITKIHYGNGKGETNTASQSNNQEQPKTKDVNTKGGDGEGFVVVTKRRKTRQQFSAGVNELYNQQSICASVR